MSRLGGTGATCASVCRLCSRARRPGAQRRCNWDIGATGGLSPVCALSWVYHTDAVDSRTARLVAYKELLLENLVQMREKLLELQAAVHRLSDEAERNAGLTPAKETVPSSG